MKNTLGIHLLALAGPAACADDLARAAETTLKLGGKTLDVLYNPGIPAAAAARAILKAGLEQAHLCMCHLEGIGHPLIPERRQPCVDLLTEAIEDVAAMREEGLQIDMIDGPISVLLGDIKPPPNALEQSLEFLKIVAPIAEKYDVRLAVEMLQRSEDSVIGSIANLAYLVGMTKSLNVGAHLDTYHFARNDQNIVRALGMFGSQTFLFHANGIGQHADTEGRIPCGCKDFDINGHRVTDTVDWATIKSFFEEGRFDCDIVLEPFHENACVAIPPLRNGVIPITDLDQIRESIRNLAAFGLISQ